MLIAVVVLAAAPLMAQERLVHAFGEFESFPSSIGVMIAAPHGTFDASTAPLAIAAARRLGAGYVVARRFTINGTRINVNRPTEDAFVACARERRTARAKEVYDLYTRTVSTAAAGRPLRLYVEIHGNSDFRTAQMIEIATTGISRGQAQSVSDEYPAMLARVRKLMPAYPEIALRIEPLDRVVFVAACVKSVGIAATDLVPRALHIELPRSARAKESQDGTALLITDIVRELLGER
jgi:hypothetical protein